MLKVILFLSVIVLTGCYQQDTIDNDSAHSNIKNFTQCAVLQDYLAESRLVYEGPKVLHKDLSPQDFVYVDPMAIWNGENESTPASAETSREFLFKRKEFIESRLHTHLHSGTYEAYFNAQESKFSPSECVMPPYIYVETDGLEIIEERAQHNRELRFGLNKTLRENRKTQPKKKFDQKEYMKLRKSAYETKQPYMLHKFSRIGINERDTQAIFFHEYFCGMTCGGGSYVIMEFDGHNWKVNGKSMVWVS